ncbi:hypothetical protein [Xenorhabdus griffiniae]|uniref:hypothetical protein n=1 Tax=Xenorhabdus griffiniae TaxID=351672 RepID=UPI00235979EE|nr:hypothetical protein [Xenorhabdus griffiniae]MDC9605346.1 hypothetical protein [Xenorhabdus griffiniae]
MNKHLMIIAFFFLTACGNSVSFSPKENELPDAKVGKLYYSTINIEGGRVIGMLAGNSVRPDDLGLHAQHCELPKEVITKNTISTKDNNCIIISGIPAKAGTATINIHGAIYSNMFKSPEEFNKIYTIKVKNK